MVRAPFSRASRSSRESSSAVTSASPAARCRAGFSKPKWRVRLSSPHERTPRTSRRASLTVQSRGPSSTHVARPPELGAHEGPVEPRVVRHEHPAAERGEHGVGQIGEAGGAPHHRFADAGEARDQGRNRPLGIDQRVEDDLTPRAVHHGDRDLGDPVPAPRAHPGGLDVHHGERAFLDQRRAARLRHQRPTAVGQLAHPRIRGQQRDREPLGHGRRGARHAEHAGAERVGGLRPLGPEQQHDPLGERRRRMGLESDHGSRRRSGRVMQRGPPPPRASSVPSIVMTMRCRASVQSSNARKSVEGTERNPAFRRASSVS